MKRVLPLLLVLGLAGIGLSACLLPRAKEEKREPGAAYVALGDSYSAAPYIGTLDGNDGCFRSRNNYPHLLAEAKDLELTDVSCSAATTDATDGEQVTPQKRRLAPQLDALGPTTRLVTVGIGANDFNLIGRIITTCVQIARTATGPSPCTALDAAAGPRSIESRLKDVQANVTRVLQDVQAKAPDAQVVMVGYPQIFPDTTTGCDDLPLADGDLPLARRFNEGLNAAVQAAATAAGAEYLDVFSATDGHGICSDDPWIAGKNVEGKGFAYHPYAKEQEVVAGLLEKVVD
ncbi:SGNH/GDSL hydrolase family protein [Pimelobacter simplex]|uniref:Putative secreted hydrolase n=1 Tax=Nocardioides simplex TaxID=2045 RepID=A0A0C5XBN5_NOCSI|nr:SGNH/GDSL hydrolase family protein [Pimelobacter simplex]AJR18705.1 putative secreted hydrolase [Pimelobacter simplex]MCG8152491.1 SGNH/GDSL hydrolase family protein [Pimelobacter simplex]GEB14603.1 lipase [Pimelobacter simplex]SFM27788.1 GDSL-like Lipase/Acylhydrolase family protein [Pimelobacter simplex]